MFCFLWFLFWLTIFRDESFKWHVDVDLQILVVLEVKMLGPCELCKICDDGENDEEPRGFVELINHWHFIWMCLSLCSSWKFGEWWLRREMNTLVGTPNKLRILLNFCCYWKMLNCGGNSLVYFFGLWLLGT